MAIRIIRRQVDKALKQEAVTLEDDHGTTMVVQQGLVHPDFHEHWYEVEGGGRRNRIHDWHEAIIEDHMRLMEKNQQNFGDFAKMLGHSVGVSVKAEKPADLAVTAVQDPMDGYKGCC